MTSKQKLFLCLLSFGFIAGCGTKLPDGMPTLYPVTLTVTQDGNVLDGAIIELSGGSGVWSASGVTDAQGQTKLHTQGRYAGVPEGTFKVTVMKTISEGDPPPSRPVDAESQKRYDEYLRSGKTFKEFHTTPIDCRNAATTPLTVTIAKGTKNVTVNVEGTVKEQIGTRGGVMNQ